MRFMQLWINELWLHEWVSISMNFIIILISQICFQKNKYVRCGIVLTGIARQLSQDVRDQQTCFQCIKVQSHRIVALCLHRRFVSINDLISKSRNNLKFNIRQKNDFVYCFCRHLFVFLCGDEPDCSVAC